MSVVITKEHLDTNPDHIFVFGDNCFHKGHGGAAALRDMPNTFGFITKTAPINTKTGYYRPYEYIEMFIFELSRLVREIEMSPSHTFLISQLGSGLANRYLIWEKVIKSGLEILRNYDNVVFLWEVDEL